MNNFSLTFKHPLHFYKLYSLQSNFLYNKIHTNLYKSLSFLSFPTPIQHSKHLNLDKLDERNICWNPGGVPFATPHRQKTQSCLIGARLVPLLPLASHSSSFWSKKWSQNWGGRMPSPLTSLRIKTFLFPFDFRHLLREGGHSLW